MSLVVTESNVMVKSDVGYNPFHHPSIYYEFQDFFRRSLASFDNGNISAGSSVQVSAVLNESGTSPTVGLKVILWLSGRWRGRRRARRT